MSDIVFVTPNFGGFVREEPIGTLLLGTILRKAGIATDILQFHHFGDVNCFDAFVNCAVEKIFAKNPRVVSFYTRCDSYHISLRIAQRVKAADPNVYVVFGGPQADLSAIDTISQIPYVDYICCGEGENTIVPFFASLIAGTPDHAICGLVFRKDGQIVQNPRPELTDDLDALPAIDYTLLDYKNEGTSTVGKRLFPIDVGRGCPFSCTYCSTKLFWGRKYRLKSAEKIIEEIKYVHNLFGETSFNFEHDMFTMNRRKVIEVCQMLKTLDFPITWRCSARLDCIDDELVDIMHDAGMRTIFLGIESGSPRVQKMINKNLKLDDIPQKLRYIASKGIHITASFIFGFPNETEEDFAQTMALMIDLSTIPGINLVPNLCAFFPGTELTAQYYDQLEDISTYSNATRGIAVMECQDIIRQNPVLFPHYREYKTELREKIQYFPKMLINWAAFRPVYQYLREKYYKDRICDFLYHSSDCNRDLLETDADKRTLLKNDRIPDKFSDDEKYPILKDIIRFLMWRNEASPGDAQVFCFDPEQLTRGVPVANLKIAPTAAYCQRTESGNLRFAFVRG